MQTAKITNDSKEYFEDYVLENIDFMLDFMKILQDGGLQLTKLILEYGKNDKYNKEDILAIFEAATLKVAETMKNSSSKIFAGSYEVYTD